MQWLLCPAIVSDIFVGGAACRTEVHQGEAGVRRKISDGDTTKILVRRPVVDRSSDSTFMRLASQLAAGREVTDWEREEVVGGEPAVADLRL